MTRSREEGELKAETCLIDNEVDIGCWLSLFVVRFGSASADWFWGFDDLDIDTGTKRLEMRDDQ